MITAIFGVCGLAITVLLSVFVNNYYLIPVWIIVGAIGGFLCAILSLLISFPFVTRNDKPKKYIAYITKSLSYFLNKFALRTKIQVVGKENIPKTGPLTVYVNHKSLADPLVLMPIFPRAITFTPKSDLYSVPFLGKWLHGMACMPIDRNNDRKTAKAMVKSINDIKNGLCMVIFPEGGIKDRSDDKMNDIKAGSYKLALKANATILPISMHGTSNIKKNAPFRRTNIYITVHKPITPEEASKMTTLEIGEKVLEVINSAV